MLQLILAVGLAILISAVCSLFEAVLYSVPLRQVEAMIQDGKFGGRTFRRLRRNVERPIAAILSLNTIANTAGAAFAGAAATAVFGHQWLGYFSAVFTLAILIFSEIIPKTAGVIYGRSLAGPVAYALKGLVWTMTPIIWLMGRITRLIGRGSRDEAVTAEEIQVMARLSRRTGGIKIFQEQAIERVLTLQEKTAKEVMTPRTVIFSLNQQLKLSEAVKAAGRWEHSRIPVFDKSPEDVVGIVHTKDVLVALAKDQTDDHLSNMMRPIHFVAESARLNMVLGEFLELRQHLFAVIDEYGGLAGLISLEDILEEILGREIVDESDEVEDKQELARKRSAIN
ncbi:MAG: HlyC/CorC family transporter [Deltaproteobacteria bacterium]|nr:HlyC/CorC family transporter [Deltaproteobacteria bacterium]